MDLDTLKEKSQEAIKNHPGKKAAIIDNYHACVAEIEDDGSEAHEVELALGSLKEIVEEA